MSARLFSTQKITKIIHFTSSAWIVDRLDKRCHVPTTSAVAAGDCVQHQWMTVIQSGHARRMLMSINTGTADCHPLSLAHGRLRNLRKSAGVKSTLRDYRKQQLKYF